MTTNNSFHRLYLNGNQVLNVGYNSGPTPAIFLPNGDVIWTDHEWFQQLVYDLEEMERNERRRTHTTDSGYHDETPPGHQKHKRHRQQ